jgi:hypothetical protein
MPPFFFVRIPTKNMHLVKVRFKEAKQFCKIHRGVNGQARRENLTCFPTLPRLPAKKNGIQQILLHEIFCLQRFVKHDIDNI